MKLPELNERTLFIFTDASVQKYGLHDEEYISCSGAVAVVWKDDKYEIIDQNFVVNRCSTNNNGEIKAIYYGLLMALKYRDQYDEINLFSDSKISIYGLREWIKGWVQHSTGTELLGSTLTPVSNQQEILACIYLIMSNNLHVNLYHQKGHCTQRVMSTALTTFKSSNHVYQFISDTFMFFICDMNDYVDKTSRDTLMRYCNQLNGPAMTGIASLVQFKYTPFNVDRYLELVTNQEV